MSATTTIAGKLCRKLREALTDSRECNGHCKPGMECDERSHYHPALTQMVDQARQRVGSRWDNSLADETTFDGRDVDLFRYEDGSMVAYVDDGQGVKRTWVLRTLRDREAGANIFAAARVASAGGTG